MGLVYASNTQQTYTNTYNGRFDAKTYKRVCILPVGDDANHTERVWNFYGTVTQANPLVPWTTSFVSGETRTADGVNVVGLEIKTGNYACKWFLHSLCKHVLISINLVTKTNGVNKILHPKSILDWQDIAKMPNNADSMLLKTLPMIVF